MPPLFACFPVCLTFVALAVLGLLVMATGLYSTSEKRRHEVPGVEMQSSLDAEETGPPPLWVIIAIFAAVALSWVLLALIAPDMKGLWPR